MIVSVCLIIGAAVFFLGFLMGLKHPPKTGRHRPDRRFGSEINTEYKDFLNYDGTVNNY